MAMRTTDKAKSLPGVNSRVVLSAFASLTLLTLAAPASAFDGRADYICTIESILECGEGRVCLSTNKGTENIAPFLEVFPEEDSARAASGDGNQQDIALTHLEEFEGVFLVQGAVPWISDRRGAVGWTMTIKEETGTMAIAGSYADGILVGYGNCINR